MPVFANGRGIVHAGSGGQSIAPVDVCQMPTPVGPVPVPYPNIGMSSDTSGGPSTVTIAGNMPMVKGATYSQSTGDQAGSVGGVLSGVTAGACEFILYSFDVKFEGKGVCRLADPLFHNKKNAPGGIEMGESVSVATAPMPGNLSKDKAKFSGTLQTPAGPLKNWPFLLRRDGKPVDQDGLKGSSPNKFEKGAWLSDADGKFKFEQLPEAYYALEVLTPRSKFKRAKPRPAGSAEAAERAKQPPATDQFAAMRLWDFSDDGRVRDELEED